VLLDTHVFLWADTTPDRLGTAVDLVADPGTTRMLSAASSWEIAIKHGVGKLPLPEPPADYVPMAMRRLVVEALPIGHVHALHVGTLPDHHRDPFDRVLVAQAQLEGLTILTADQALVDYEVDVIVV
jgi:PIN domain nuclease of toxin-antitoxin system